MVCKPRYASRIYLYLLIEVPYEKCIPNPYYDTTSNYSLRYQPLMYQCKVKLINLPLHDIIRYIHHNLL